MGRHKTSKISPIKRHFNEDLIPYIENTCSRTFPSDIHGTTYWYKEKCEGRNLPIQELKIPYKKVSRKFIYDIVNKYPNKGTVGLCSYLALKSHSVSSTKFYKGKGSPNNSWVSGSKTFFEKITGDDNFFQTKFKRKEKFCGLKNLILTTGLKCNLSERELSGRIYFSFPEQTTQKNVSNDKIKAEFAAINSNVGYIFSRFDIGDLLFNSIGGKLTVSDCDALCDLWMNTVFNDEEYSFTRNMPLVMFSEKELHQGYDMLNGVCPLNSSESISNSRIVTDKNVEICTTTMRQLSQRWGMSLGRTHNLLEKFKKDGFIDYVSIPNRGITIIMKCFQKYLWDIDYEPVCVYEIFKKYFPDSYDEIYKNYITKKVALFISKMRSVKNAKEKESFSKSFLHFLSNESYFFDKNLRSFSEKIFKRIMFKIDSVYRCLRGSPPCLKA